MMKTMMIMNKKNFKNMKILNDFKIDCVNYLKNIIKKSCFHFIKFII